MDLDSIKSKAIKKSCNSYSDCLLNTLYYRCMFIKTGFWKIHFICWCWINRPQQACPCPYIQTTKVHYQNNNRIGSGNNFNNFNFCCISVIGWFAVLPNFKGLVQLQPRLYSGWGFHTSQWDRQLKFSAYASFLILWRLSKFELI